MEADEWEQIERLFEEARAVSPDERAGFLRTHCDDRAVRAEVASLLDAREEAPGFFDAAAEQVVAPALDEFEGAGVPEGSEREALDLAGQRVGAYRLVEEIGVGGMSVVYRAERARGDYERTVAVKLLQRRLHTEAVEERFRAERQVLASLDHPNIAGLIDGGVTEGGRPYLVMEHVDGVPLTTYADEHDLGVEARLDLLEQVVEAVQAAHRQLVVHRDLKPSNVLVTETESGPQPKTTSSQPVGAQPGDYFLTPVGAQVKLLDFGIAKLMGEALPVTRPETRTGQHLLTPAYAAPEQVAGDEITTATDVYLLGVLAYELLSGTRPFDLAEKSLTELERILMEEEPQSPSQAAERFGDRVRGDLDQIVLKALRKEPERRYRSVEALAADLDRYREGEPVEARPATPGYRVRKFVSRNRTTVIAGLVILLLGVAYAVTVSVQANRLAEQRDQAQREAQTAEEVSEMLVGLFEASSPYERPDTLTARTLLRRGEDRISQLGDQPAAQAQLLGAMGRAHQALGDYQRADSLFGRARGLRSRLYDPPHPEVATSLNDYGEVQRMRGQYARADSLHTKALAMRRRLYDSPHSEIAESLHNLGVVKTDREALSAADSLLREALSMRRALHDGDHRTVAVLLNDLGILLGDRGKYAASDSVFREALSLKSEQLGPRHPSIATTLSNLGASLSQQGRHRAADSVFRKALSIRREQLGSRHPETAMTLNNLGLTLRERAMYAAADSVFRNALAIAREKFGPRHPETAATLNNLGITLYSQGKYAAADSVYREVLAIDRERLRPRHPDIATTLINLGSALRRQAQYSKADSVFREALDIRREQLGPRHPETATALVNLAGVLRLQNRYSVADSLYREGLAIRREQFGSKHAETAGALNRLALSKYGQGQYEAADSLFREAFSIRREQLGPRHPETATTLNNLGGALYAQGKYAAVDSVFREVLSIRRERLGPQHPATATVLSNLGSVAQNRDKYEEAEKHFREALSIRHAALRAGHPNTQASLQKLVKLYETWGRPEREAAYRDSLSALSAQSP